jgi:hypothetical protein
MAVAAFSPYPIPKENCIMRHHAFALLVTSVLVLAGAQAASPVAAAVQPTVIASGLVNPKGFTWGPDGAMYIALADSAGGGARPQVEPVPATRTTGAAGAQPTVPGIGSTHAGTRSGSVVKIVNGCPVTVASGFPSATDPNLGWAFGVSAVAFLNGQLYALVDGGGASTQNPNLPNGIYRVNTDGTPTLVADLSAWLRANEVSDPHEPLTPDGEPFAMIAVGDALLVSESNHEQLLRISPDGTIARMIDFSPFGDSVPTGFAPAADGGIYIGFLSPLPFEAGTAKVMKVDAGGHATDVWTGLTAVTAIAVGPDGTLYATELTTGPDSGTKPPFVIPGTGKIVKQTGPSSSVDVVTGLTAPDSLAFGPDGGLYVGGPAIGAYHNEGMILRIDPSATSAVDVSDLARATTSVACTARHAGVSNAR